MWLVAQHTGDLHNFQSQSVCMKRFGHEEAHAFILHYSNFRHKHICLCLCGIYINFDSFSILSYSLT